MKTHFPRLILIALCATLSQASAQLTWDANGTGSGQTDGAGIWPNPNQWWNGTANTTWSNATPDSAIIGMGGAGGAITLGGNVSAGTIQFNPFTGTYTIQGTGTTLTQSGGITIGASAGNVTFKGTGGSPNNLTLGGAGGITMNGSGLLSIRENLVASYTGPTVINNGTVMVFNNKAASNFRLNSGILTDYYQATTVFTGGLGVGDNQIQIYGSSGFGGGNGTSTWRIGTAGSTLIWGASGEGTATGFFNPTTLRFLAPAADNMGPSNYGQVTLDNALDLNGGARTISVAQATGTNAIANSRAIATRNITGTGGGSLTKTGGGNLALSGTNDYSGGTTISNGMIRFDTRASMPASGTVSIADGAILGVAVASSGTTWGAGTGVAGIAGLTSTANSGGGYGGQSGAVVNFAGNSSLLLNVTANTTESNNIGNGGSTNLSIIKTGGSSLTLSGSNNYSGRTWVHTGTLSYNSIASVGGGNSALGTPSTVSNGTISVGSDGNTATLAYTGTGHSSDRVINLTAASGTAGIDASGTGPLTLTSSITAAAGAKTLNLTGTNTGANTLGTSAIPTLAEVLSITKNGAGTWWINGFSSPKNAWSVTAGTLVLAGQITTGDQQITVSGGTLAGIGPITMQSGKILTVQAAGSLAPGNQTVGTLAITGVLNISAMASGTGKLNFDMAAPNASDRIAVTGTAQIGSGLLGLNDFIFTDLGGMTSSTYTLISTTGGITGSLDPANVSGSIGSISGILRINGNNLEFTTDQDGDGLPDAYELANTSPPSTTALSPTADLENGGTGDGLNNLQEYLAGTNPNDPDTDDDGLLDGVETNTGIFLNSTNTGTKPLVFDTDGDTIRDGYETNTGIFLNSTNTGTNPNNPDTDVDSFADNVETNTGVYVSKTNTGTNPNNPDTDNDGAGDWYEVTASFTSPFLASEKPNIPYPLPDPDASTGATNKPVKVYIMSGQSNMVGIGYISGGPGSLNTIAKTEGKFPNLVDSSNSYTTRNDVRYRGVVTAIGNGLLTPGIGNADRLGPELGFGHVMGYYHDEPVLLLKASQGNRGLFWDILPPASPSFSHTDGYTYAGYGQSPSKWLTAGGAPSPGIWYAGKQYDDFFKTEIDMGVSAWSAGLDYQASGNLGSQVLNNGVQYICKLPHTSSATSEPGIGSQWTTFWNVYSIENASDVLDNFATQYPQWAAQGFQIAGYVWFQGNWDLQGSLSASRYEINLVRFINETRSYFANRYPGKASTTTPFVLSTGCGDRGTSGNGLTVANAQLAMNNATTYPSFAGNVKTIDNRSYWRELSESPGTQGFHYNNNAETYMLTGDALGRAMIDLQPPAPPANSYANWIAGYPSVPSNLAGFDQDADGDGIDNGAENFFGTNPGIGSSGLVSGTSSGNTFVFTHPQNATPASGVTGTYRWSKDLAAFRNGGQTDSSGTTVNFSTVINAGITTVTATVTGTPTAKLFVDVKVIQN